MPGAEKILEAGARNEPRLAIDLATSASSNEI